MRFGRCKSTGRANTRNATKSENEKWWCNWIKKQFSWVHLKHTINMLMFVSHVSAPLHCIHNSDKRPKRTLLTSLIAAPTLRFAVEKESKSTLFDARRLPNGVFGCGFDIERSTQKREPHALRNFRWFINFHTGFCLHASGDVCVDVCECQDWGVCDRKTCQFSSIQTCFAIAAPLQVNWYIQSNSMKTYTLNAVSARFSHSTPPTLKRNGTFLVIHTANGSAGFVLDVINNLRWKSKPDFWFSVFHLFSHIIDPCVRLCAGVWMCCVRYRCIICQFADASHRVDAFTCIWRNNHRRGDASVCNVFRIKANYLMIQSARWFNREQQAGWLAGRLDEQL